MKTLYLFVGAILFSLSTYAQITITYPENVPSIGSSYNMIINTDIEQTYSSDFLNLSGANQTWDLSEIAGETSEQVVLNPSSGNDYVNYPNANLLETSTNLGTADSEAYYRYADGIYYIDGTTMYMPGETSEPFVRIAYSDPRMFSKLPLTFGETETDDFSGIFENILANQDFTRAGSVTLEADGFGQVILPYGTIGDVLRVKLISTYSDTYLGQELLTYTETQYLWYQAETSTYLATYNELYSNGILSSRIASHLSAEDFLTVKEEKLKADLKIYPNPSSDQVNIQFENQNDYHYSITDIQGKVIQQGTSQEFLSNKITVSDLNPGVYTFNAILEAESVSKRFIIK